MSSLCDDIQYFINDFRRSFIIACQKTGGLRLLDEAGEENGDGRPNEPVGRF